MVRSGGTLEGNRFRCQGRNIHVNLHEKKNTVYALIL